MSGGRLSHAKRRAIYGSQPAKAKPPHDHGFTSAQLHAMCETKNRYVSQEVARATAAHLYEISRATEPALYTYRCPACRGWHLTKRATGNGAPVTSSSIYDEGAAPWA